MHILRNRNELEDLLAQIREKNFQIGLIPTMGSIHKGHISLIEKSIKNKYFSLASIYINPTQFNDRKDYLSYPREEKEDIKKISNANCDALYFPTLEEMYPSGIKSKKTVKKYRNILCDIFRPGHFDGVTTLVESLLKVVKPDCTFFGEKDFQQLKIIETLSQILKLNIKVIACASIRLENGMSISSRFKKFSEDDKKIFNKCANQIKKLIYDIKKNINQVNLENFKLSLQNIGVKKIDYLEIRRENNLLLSNTCNQSRLFIALLIGNIRVVDNFVLY